MRPTRPDIPAPAGVRQSVWDVALVLPRDGHVGVEDLKEALGLSASALNTRITRAKQAGLVEAAGWGRYKLSEKGMKLRWQDPRIVSPVS